MTKWLIALALVGLVWMMFRRAPVKASTMRPSEARTLLGVDDQASLEEIRDAHRRLIAKVHPDAGGSAGLATRVNTARDTLVAELRRG